MSNECLRHALQILNQKHSYCSHSAQHDKIFSNFEVCKQAHRKLQLNLGLTEPDWAFHCTLSTETTTSRQLKEIQSKTNSENRHLVFLIFKKEQENDGVGDISSLFQRHCQTIVIGLTMSLE